MLVCLVLYLLMYLCVCLSSYVDLQLAYPLVSVYIDNLRLGASDPLSFKGFKVLKGFRAFRGFRISGASSTPGVSGKSHDSWHWL